MAELVLRDVWKAYGRVDALAGVDLRVAPGSLTAVLGPSGCGKTTLLRCVAGFERIDAGTVTVDGRTLAGPGSHLPPHRRRIAVVPQEGALFPHLSVAGNVAYGLDRAARRAGRVEEVLALVGLDGYGARMPHQLSGGQQQRVAVARALAPRPPLVLLDEPFSALDAALRGGLRRDIREALRADGATAVLVTHDRGEALSMADEVAVLRAGRIVQCGTPDRVYQEPADEWVAGFLGEVLVLSGTVGPTATVQSPLGPLAVSATTGLTAGAQAPVTVLVRPEQVDLLPAGTSVASDVGVTAAARGVVVGQEFFGHDALVAVKLTDGTEVSARILAAAPAVAIGDPVRLRVRGPVRVLTEPTPAKSRPGPLTPGPPQHD